MTATVPTVTRMCRLCGGTGEGRGLASPLCPDCAGQGAVEEVDADALVSALLEAKSRWAVLSVRLVWVTDPVTALAVAEEKVRWEREMGRLQDACDANGVDWRGIGGVS